VTKSLGNIQKEYIELEYKNSDKLYVPVTELGSISKYVEKENPPITPLSGRVWEKKIKKMQEETAEIAEELLSNFSKRSIRPGKKYMHFQKHIREFQSNFPYPYTPDQESSIEDIF